jgi:SPP1 gp7 family putative phage head morphogenesis protein
MLGVDFYKVPTKVIDEITKSTRLIQGYEAKELFKVTSDNHARQLKVLVGAGVAQGMPASKIIQNIKQKSTKLTKGQLKTSVFTSITEARAVTRHDSYKKLESLGVVKGYEYVSTLDSRTSEYCRDHDGRKYYKEIDEIASEINVHFNCRSVFKPISSKETTRASIDGPVPANETYSEWFKRQPEDFQKTTLGSKKFKAYKSGAYKIGGLPDVRGTSLSLEKINETLQDHYESL